MPTTYRSFDEWLAECWGAQWYDVEKVLKDPRAMRFLIAWTMFESRCFDREATPGKFQEFAQRIASQYAKPPDPLVHAAEHFHERYQDADHYRRLIQRDRNRAASLDSILRKAFPQVAPDEVLLLLVWVVYRYRNNKFHGNKRLDSWRQYDPQTDLCLVAMQELVSVTP